MPNHVIRDRIWKSRKLAKCSSQAAMAYPWIYLVADEWGRFEYRPHMIHGEVFAPRSEYSPEDMPSVADVASWLTEYDRQGLLVRYHLNGDLAYWTNFYGRAIKDRRPSQYPDPEQFTSGRGEFGSGRGQNRSEVVADSNPKIGTPQVLEPSQFKSGRIEQEQEQEQEQRITTPLPPAGAGDSEMVRQVFDCWQSVMGHADAKLLTKRRRLVMARLREGYTVAQLCDAVAGCKASTFHMGQNDTGTVYDDLTLICRSGEKVEMFISKLSQSTALVAVSGGRSLSVKPSSGERTGDAIRNFVRRRSGM